MRTKLIEIAKGGRFLSTFLVLYVALGGATATHAAFIYAPLWTFTPGADDCCGGKLSLSLTIERTPFSNDDEGVLSYSVALFQDGYFSDTQLGVFGGATDVPAYEVGDPMTIPIVLTMSNFHIPPPPNSISVYGLIQRTGGDWGHSWTKIQTPTVTLSCPEPATTLAGLLCLGLATAGALRRAQTAAH